MSRWQRAFVWTIGAIHIASSVFMMMVVGAIADGPPDPRNLQDALLGLTVGLALHGGLMSAPFVVTASPVYRILIAATMLPAAWFQARGLEYVMMALQHGWMLLWTPGVILPVTGAAAYVAQFCWLARGRRPEVLQAAA